VILASVTTTAVPMDDADDPDDERPNVLVTIPPGERVWIVALESGRLVIELKDYSRCVVDKDIVRRSRV